MAKAPAKTAPRAPVALGDAILAELRTGKLPSGPQHFELWFAYKTGRTPALNVAVDEIRARRELTSEDIERLYGQHLSPWRMSAGLADLTDDLAEELHGVAATLDSALGSALAQREILMAESCDLSIAGALTLRRILEAVDRLMHSAKDGQARFSLIDARLKAAAGEIGALRRQIDTVRTHCQTDPLTSLPNRNSFERLLSALLTQTQAARAPLALALCDLDYFSAFNDSFGQGVGDEALRAVAVLLQTHMRNGDVVSRIGDDEFAIILPRTRISDAITLAERFRQVLITHEFIAGAPGNGRLTVSIGVADAIKGDLSEYLSRRAGNGLKVAKKEGRNRVVEMTPDGPVWTAKRRV